MTLAERLSELVRAAFSGLYVVSREHDDAVDEIAALCRRGGWSLAAWDADRGLEAPGRPAEPGAADPIAAVRALAALATPDGTALLVLRNFHRYLGSPEVAQALDARLSAGRRERTFVVVLAPLVQLPPELEAQFVVVEHEPPGRDQLEAIARGVATEPGELPGGDDLAAVLDAAAGLARAEAEGAFALSLVRHGRLAPAPLWEVRMLGIAIPPQIITCSTPRGVFVGFGRLPLRPRPPLRSAQRLAASSSGSVRPVIR